MNIFKLQQAYFDLFYKVKKYQIKRFVHKRTAGYCDKNFSLTNEQKQQVIDFCVLQDLSLGEVSDLLNISRQAVKYTLDNATASMLKLEQELKILNKIQSLRQKLTNLLECTNDDNIKQQINNILEEL